MRSESKATRRTHEAGLALASHAHACIRSCMVCHACSKQQNSSEQTRVPPGALARGQEAQDELADVRQVGLQDSDQGDKRCICWEGWKISEAHVFAESW